MFNLSRLYSPITANPAHASEFQPSLALQPYIRCFWGSVDDTSSKPLSPHKMETVIPDTCMDIIWSLDRETGNSNIFFSGINDTPFDVSSDTERGTHSRFGIRFHFWAVHNFADDHLRNVLNAHVDVEQYFGSFKKSWGTY